MAHEGRVNWESEVYEQSGLGGGGPGDGAAGRQRAETRISAAHMETGTAMKCFFFSIPSTVGKLSAVREFENRT